MCDIDESKLTTNDDEGSDVESYGHVTKLVDGLNLSELSQGTTFQIKPDDVSQSFENEMNSYFGNEEILKHVKFECLGSDSEGDEDGPCVPGDTPFEKYAAKMKDISSDGSVKKKVRQQGDKNSPKVPEGALVTIHYNLYNEFIEEPFDSTYMRTGPQKFRLGSGNLLPGLELAIGTMCRNERSWFLIQPELAYGKLGCPPRIPPNATILFDCHLLDYIDSGGAANYDALSPEEQKNAEFSVVLSAAKGLYLQGNDLFKNRNYGQATKRYSRAANLLENCSTVKDEKDEKDMNHILAKLYVNLGVTYNLLNEPRRACIFTKKALSLDPSNVKALFNRGKALRMLSDFREARHFLLAAKRIEPYNHAVTKELTELEKKQRDFEEGERAVCQRMFSSAPKPKEAEAPKKERTRLTVTDGFRETATKDLEEFKNSDRKEPINFPHGLTTSEIEFTRSTAENLGLKVNISSNGRITIYK